MKMLLLSLLFFPVLAFTAINKKQFEETVSNVISIYHEELSQINENVVLTLDWNSKVTDSIVSRSNEKLLLKFQGALTKNYNLTSDALALSVCHEIGHLLGGFPYILPTTKYSSEAQADYFSTKECFKKYSKLNPFFRNNNLTKLSPKQIKSCKRKRECLRGLYAIENLSKSFADSKNASINSYESSRVLRTNYNNYPSSQCRIDTLRAGLLCNKKVCKVGKSARPNCWYKRDLKISKNQLYSENYIYQKAQVIAKVTAIEETKLGCKVFIKKIDYFSSSYFSNFTEVDLIDQGINIIGKCNYNYGSSLLGNITLFNQEYYFNIPQSDL